MNIRVEKRKGLDCVATYRIWIGSHFQDLSQNEVESLFGQMSDVLDIRCRIILGDESSKDIRIIK